MNRKILLLRDLFCWGWMFFTPPFHPLWSRLIFEFGRFGRRKMGRVEDQTPETVEKVGFRDWSNAGKFECMDMNFWTLVGKWPDLSRKRFDDNGLEIAEYWKKSFSRKRVLCNLRVRETSASKIISAPTVLIYPPHKNWFHLSPIYLLLHSIRSVRKKSRGFLQKEKKKEPVVKYCPSCRWHVIKYWQTEWFRTFFSIALFVEDKK